MSNSNLSYRPEIDGLRTIAVLAVVIYHAQISWNGFLLFSGGFIGVDVFFVISGYLITRLIIHELNEGAFSFQNFFMRRARRILPILFLVILVTLPVAWWLMLPQALEEYAVSVLATMTMTSNFLFWQQDSYWAVANELNPLLHTWSLAIEEQFYIIFPPMFLLVWKFARHHLTTLLIVAIIGSLLAAILTVPTHPEAAFYLPYSRAWELGLGAFIANIENKTGRTKGLQYASIFTAIGLLAVFIPAILYSSETLHPSIYTVLPVIGTCLLIWFCGGSDWVSRFLATKIMVKIGLLSYGWYLWHYPFFAFARIYDDTLGNIEMFGLSLVSLLLAWLSYHLLEQPMRNRQKISLKNFSLIGASCFAFIIAFALFAVVDNGNLGRFTHQQLVSLGIGKSKKDYTTYVVDKYNTLVRRKDFTNSNRKRILLIGDSYSQDFYNILDEAGLLKDVELIGHYIPGKCFNVPDGAKADKLVKEKDRAVCKKITRVGNEALNARIKAAHAIIVASRWNNHTTRRVVELQQTLKSLGGKNILIVGKKNFHPPEKLIDYIISKDPNKKNKFVITKAQLRIVEKFEALAPSLDNYLDLQGLLCSADHQCPATTPDDYLMSYDGDHLTQEGAKHFADLMKKSPMFLEYWRAVQGSSNP